MKHQTFKAAAIAGLALLVAACGSGKDSTGGETDAATKAAAGGKATGEIVNVYNWSDYIDPEVIKDFEQETGIKVRYDVFDSNEVLETKLLTGNSGYDVVVPSAYFLERQVKAGVFAPLDKAKLPGLANVDPDLARSAARHDPDNAHSVVYMWGTTGIGYDRAKVQAIMPDAPLDSWQLIFDPAVISKFKDCGISMLDDPTDMVGTALLYLGKDPNSEAEADLKAAEAALMKIRPYLRTIHSSQYIDQLANGELCIVVGYSGDVLQASDRAEEAGKPLDIGYSIPKEGALMWFDTLAIPVDAIIAYLIPIFWMSIVQGFGFLPHFSYGRAVRQVRQPAEALHDRHPEDGDQVRDDQHDVLRDLRPGHCAHAAEHRAHQDAEQAEPHADLERNLECACRDRPGGGDLRRHVGERRDHQHDDRAEARQLAAVTRADEVRHRVAAELAQVRRHQRRDQDVAAGPAHDEGHVRVAGHEDAAGHRDEGRARHPVGRRRHAVEHRRDAAPGDVVGLDRHRARENADERVDRDREQHEQDADPFRAHAERLEERHQREKREEAACVDSVDFRQVVGERLAFPLHAHVAPPYSRSSTPNLTSIACCCRLNRNSWTTNTISDPCAEK